MSKSLTTLFYILIVSNLFAQFNYKLSGNFTAPAKNGKVFLSYSTDSTYVKDSAIILNGKFYFKGKINYPIIATLEYNNNSRDIFLDNGTISVDGSDIEAATVRSNKSQEELDWFQKTTKPLEDSIDALGTKYDEFKSSKKDTALQNLIKSIRKYSLKIEAIKDTFILQHPHSFLSFHFVQERSLIITKPEKFAFFYNALSQDLKNTPTGKLLNYRLKIARKVAIGQPFTDFTLADINGNSIKLSKLKGKYILIDFWASWCGPCRAENPNLLKAYNLFKNKNFDIVAISMDENRESWIKAIEKDAMPWLQLSDFKGFEGPVPIEYGIIGIPQNFLIDPDGKIIGRNLFREELHKKLNEVL